jgi:hypothetical protein
MRAQLERRLLNVLALDTRQQRAQICQHPPTAGHPIAWRTRQCNGQLYTHAIQRSCWVERIVMFIEAFGMFVGPHRNCGFPFASRFLRPGWQPLADQLEDAAHAGNDTESGFKWYARPIIRVIPCRRPNWCAVVRVFAHVLPPIGVPSMSKLVGLRRRMSMVHPLCPISSSGDPEAGESYLPRKYRSWPRR